MTQRVPEPGGQTLDEGIEELGLSDEDRELIVEFLALSEAALHGEDPYLADLAVRVHYLLNPNPGLGEYLEKRGGVQDPDRSSCGGSPGWPSGHS